MMEITANNRYGRKLLLEGLPHALLEVHHEPGQLTLLEDYGVT